MKVWQVAERQDAVVHEDAPALRGAVRGEARRRGGGGQPGEGPARPLQHAHTKCGYMRRMTPSGCSDAAANPAFAAYISMSALPTWTQSRCDKVRWVRQSSTFLRDAIAAERGCTEVCSAHVASECFAPQCNLALSPLKSQWRYKSGDEGRQCRVITYSRCSLPFRAIREGRPTCRSG